MRAHERETDRQTDRERQRDRDTERDRHRERQTERDRDREMRKKRKRQRNLISQVLYKEERIRSFRCAILHWLINILFMVTLYCVLFMKYDKVFNKYIYVYQLSCCYTTITIVVDWRKCCSKFITPSYG